MKKIKVSELPLCSTLKGLFTLGTDKDNRSVKVSLEFIKEETDAAVKNAQDATAAAVSDAQAATTAANTAKQNADAAASAANTAAGKATAAATSATSAASAANTAAGKANAAKQAADTATAAANTATGNANTATASATSAASAANAAAEEAIQATEAAEEATASTIAAVTKLIPTGLEVSAPERITLGNTAENRVEATLSPSNTMPNIIFISDNNAVKIDQKGRIRVVGIGASEVQIIPTCNTALAKTIIINVTAATLRLKSRTQLRLTQSGGLLLN